MRANQKMAARLERVRTDWIRAHNIRELGGTLPAGKVLHKGRGEGYDVQPCDRYLIVTDEVWLLLDRDNKVIQNDGADFFGRIHWEDQCPSGFGAAK